MLREEVRVTDRAMARVRIGMRACDFVSLQVVLEGGWQPGPHDGPQRRYLGLAHRGADFAAHGDGTWGGPRCGRRHRADKPGT